MEFSEVKTICLAVLISSAVWTVRSQTPGNVQTDPLAGLKADPANVGEVLREIDDPHTGYRWLLTVDPSHPGGPGRLTPAMTNASPGKRATPPARAQQFPAIRTGDRLIVEESTDRVQARLEAVALGPAQPGLRLNVRLIIGGVVLRAVALGPGRAAIATEMRTRP